MVLLQLLGRVRWPSTGSTGLLSEAGKGPRLPAGTTIVANAGVAAIGFLQQARKILRDQGQEKAATATPLAKKRKRQKFSGDGLPEGIPNFRSAVQEFLQLLYHRRNTEGPCEEYGVVTSKDSDGTKWFRGTLKVPRFAADREFCDGRLHERPALAKEGAAKAFWDDPVVEAARKSLDELHSRGR
ncbi:unnamed protein product [Symbiodinium sp. CCMP2456]|nr:unnamed protein product [Symbiodinium sp. CCMP2456]